MQLRIEPDLTQAVRLAAVKKRLSVPKFVSNVLRSHLKRSKLRK